MVVSGRRISAWRQQHFAAIEARARSRFAGRWLRRKRLAARLGTGAVADGGDARSPALRRARADAVEFFHGQRRQKSFFFARGDHAEAARALEREAMEATTLVRRADGTLKPVRARTSVSAAQRGFVIWVERSVPANRGRSRPARRFPPRACRFRGCGARAPQNRRSARTVGTTMACGRCAGLRGSPSRFHAEEFRFVACRSHTAAPDEYGLRAAWDSALARPTRKMRLHPRERCGNRVGNFALEVLHSPSQPGGPGIFSDAGSVCGVSEESAGLKPCATVSCSASVS